MKSLIAVLANIAGGAGLFVALGAGLARLSGHHLLPGFETMTLYHGGVGLLVVGCFLKLHQLTSR